MGQEPTGLGLVGLGNWGRRLAGCVEQASAGHLVSCFGRNEERRRAFAEQVGTEAAASLESMFDDDRIDAVIIATPHTTHAD
ncbi:MAG: gfo/Idh/MocA family oxidoreductase, partial [Actinobacteria bacterium]|nr:gfo/Idh/MocA family oxidoreductase [Actinomycetota bacterium]